jgi:hypothetical protein
LLNQLFSFFKGDSLLTYAAQTIPKLKTRGGAGAAACSSQQAEQSKSASGGSKKSNKKK